MKQIKVKERHDHLLTQRLFYTLGAIIFYQLLMFIPIPGVNNEVLKSLNNNNGLFMISMFSGGNYTTFSVMTMGLTSFVTAQIIVQLLQANLSKRVTSWSKSGRTGRHKINQLTRFLTIIFSIFQGLAITYGLSVLSDFHFLLINSVWMYAYIVLVLTSGTFFATWLGDRITEKGLGNGIAVIIGVNIIFQTILQTSWKTIRQIKESGYLPYLIVFTLIFVFIIIWFNESELRIPVLYARRNNYAGSLSYMPVKIVTANIMPIIFASTIMAIPQVILMFWQKEWYQPWFRVIDTLFSWQSSFGIFNYSCLIILFTYLYSTIQVDPEKVAENFRKQEAFIPGVNPGHETEEYLRFLLNRLAFPDSIFLLIISIAPMVVFKNTGVQQLGISGSSLLIVLGILTEIIRQAKGLHTKKDFPPFLSSYYTFS